MAGPWRHQGHVHPLTPARNPCACLQLLGEGGGWFGLVALLCSALSWPGWPLAHLELEDEREMGARFLGFLLARFGEWGRRGVMSLSG